MSEKKIIRESGKRKSAIARATVKAGKGRVRVNRIPIEIWSPEIARMKMMEPLYLSGKLAEKVDITVTVSGGGIMGQADAVKTAIARGLVEYYKDKNPGLREKFLRYDRSLLVSDPRRKEAKHFLGRGARKKRQKSFR